MAEFTLLFIPKHVKLCLQNAITKRCFFFFLFSSLSDSHGHIDPSLRPIWDLAFLGSSYMMWEKTTQFLHYYMAQISSVNQWVRKKKPLKINFMS